MPTLRLRWSDLEPDNPSAPVDWRYTSLIIATLFLNFSFCENYGLRLGSFGSLAVDAGVIGVAALSHTALFFIGPALAAQASRRSIFGLLEHSFGSIPVLVLRVCVVAFLALWIAHLVTVPALWAFAYVPRPERPLTETRLMAAGIVVFLFLTGLQSIRTSARLALFTNKLFIAILIAAFIRVRDGWPAVLAAYPTTGYGEPAVQRLWHDLSQLAFYAAPLLLLAAGSAARSAGRKQVALSGLTGSALPIFAAMTLSAVVGAATGGRGEGLPPTIAVALFSAVANSAVSSRMFIFAITTFGAARFGVRALWDAASVRPFGRSKWVLMGCFVAAITWLSLHPDAAEQEGIPEISATCLVVAGAVVTADFVSGRPRFERVCKVDWVAVAAFMAGMVVPLSLPSRYGWGAEGWWFPWVMPSYAVGFLVCVCGRALEKAHLTRGFHKVPE